MLSLEESGCADETSRRRAASRRRLVSEVIILFLDIFIPTNYREFSVKKWYDFRFSLSGMSFYFRLLGPILRFYRKDHDVLNLTKVRCCRHTFYTPAVIHEHIFDMEIVWLSGCHQRIGLFPI